MIPAAFVTAWSARAPWPSPAQVEQDLLLSRVLIEMCQLYTVTTKAIASVMKVIARADDSTGIIGDACRCRLECTARYVGLLSHAHVNA